MRIYGREDKCGFLLLVWICFIGNAFARNDFESVGRENEDLIAHLSEDDYELVYPTQIRDKIRVGIDTQNHFFKNATFHHVTASFVIKTLADRVRIHLKLNRLLLPDRGLTKWFNYSESQILENEKVENCFYQGEVHGDPQSFVAMSTCNGLDGVVYWLNTTYVIKPLKGVAKDIYLTRRHPHIWYRQPESTEKGVCGTSGVADWDYTGNRKASSKRRYKRDAQNDMKFLEVAVVADSSLTSEFKSDQKAVLNHLLQAVNVADLIFQSMSIRLSLVYTESWLTLAESRMSITGDAAETLLNLFDYAATQLYTTPKDLVIFVTRKKFKQQTILMSASGSICSAKAAAVVKDANFKESFQLGSLISHAIGHVIGMKHDSLNANSYACSCQLPGGCLLQDPTVRVSSFPHSFSTCNREEFFDLLNNGNLRCLFNKPLESDPLENCGNKLVDPGEQCDCGSVEECDMIDPCCDPITCKLRSGSECAAGSCCQDCKLKPEGILCREAVAECDVPEFCTGTSGQCPADGHKMNGIECGHKLGYCYQGSCASANSQCQDIWGTDARSSPSECYQKFNVRGTETGHCGVHSNGDYIPCNTSDVMCGLIQCRGTREIPSIDQFTGAYYKIEFPVDGAIAQCRVAFDTKRTDFGLVKEGTKCGRNMICVDRHCVPISSVTPDPQCPTNNLALQCSGHGVCTNLNSCYCEPGWTGMDCSYRASMSTLSPSVILRSNDNTSIESRKSKNGVSLAEQNHMDLHSMLIILGGVSGAVVVVVLFFILCYRRRTSSALEKKQKLLGTVAFSKDYECNSQRSESSADTAHRSIKFGHMPSYRNEKIKGGKKRRHRNGSRSMKEIDERSATSEQSMEQQQPLMAGGPQIENTTVNGSQVMMNEVQRQPEKGILKNYPSFSTAPVGRPSYGRCYSDVDGPSSASAINTPHLAHSGGRRSGRKRSDGYESDTYASHLMFERSLRRLNDYDLCQQQIFIDQMESQETYDLDTEVDRHAQMSFEKDMSVRQQSRASGRSRFGNNSNVNSPFMGRGVLSHVNENRSVQPADEEADCSFSRSEDNNCSFSENEGPPQKFSGRTAPKRDGQQDLSGSKGYRQGQAETPSDSSSEGRHLLKSRGFPQNDYSHAQREDSAPECLSQQKIGSPLQDKSPIDRQTKVAEDGGSGESRRISPTNSVASSGRGSFLGRPQPLKLRNIEYLLKQLDSHSLDLSPASSTEMSAPEADKAFAAVEIGSHTESQQGGQDMADPIFSPSNDYGRAEAHLHHYNTSQQLCNFDDSSGYPPQAYGEEPIDPSYMAEGFGPVSTNFNSPNTPSPFKIEQVANGRHNGSKWTKGENANMRSFNDGFHQQQFPQPRVPPRGDTSSTSRSQLGNGRFNSFSRPNDDYDCGGNH